MADTFAVPFNINAADRALTEEALRRTGSIVGAAEMLGITRHALKRRIIKHGIRWTRETHATRFAAQQGGAS